MNADLSSGTSTTTSATATTTTATVCVVEIREPGRAPQRLRILGTVVVGRGGDAYEVSDQRVSRRHLRLAATAGSLIGTDLGSSNGTRLNDEPLRGSAALRPGDVLALGGTEITVVSVAADGALLMTRARGAIRALTVQAAPQRHTIEIRGEAGGARRISLGVVTDLGRENVTVVLEDPRVSRRHLRLTAGPSGLVAVDLGSRNGTFLNGALITGPTQVSDGDQLRIGATVIMLADSPAPSGRAAALGAPAIPPPSPPPTHPSAPIPALPSALIPAPIPAPPSAAPPTQPHRPPLPDFPNYLQIPSRVPLPVWHGIRIVSVVCYLALCGTLFVRPEAGLFLFWNLVVPLLPIVFLVAPGLWRNVCPLAASNQFSRLVGIGGRRTAPAWLARHGFLISATALVAIVTSRKVLFDSAGPALAILLLATVALAFSGGLLLKGKSGWCSSVCPLLPVQRLYGQTPLILVPNSHCRPCVGCTKNCYDFNPRVAYQADLRDPDPGWSAPRRLFAGSFPGLIVGYFTIPTPPAITVPEMYLRFAVCLLVSAGSYFALDAVLRGWSARLAGLYAAVALTLFYVYQAGPITVTVGRIAGVDAGPAAGPLRLVVGLLAVAWLWRTFGTERRFLAQVAAKPSGPPAPATPPGVTHARLAGRGQPEVRFLPDERRIVAAVGRTLLEVAEADGLPVEAGCRMGMCGADPVAVLEGADNLSPLDDTEASTLARLGYGGTSRLACCARVHGDVVVSLTPDATASPGADDPLEHPGPGDPSVRRVVIVGHGIAGVTAADLVRRRHPDCELHLVGQEPHPLYNRMAISRLIHGRSAMQGLYLQPDAWYEQRRITCWLNTRVAAVDVSGRQVVLATGDRLDYDRLILANGSAAAVPPIGGFGRPGSFVLREATDAIAVRAFAQRHGARTAVVAGGGLLGLEAAYALQQFGLGVTVLERSAGLLRRQVDERCSTLLTGYLEELGIRVVPDAVVDSLAGQDRIEMVTLADGRSLASDLLVVCTGIRPDVDLARDAGIVVHRGVVVDDRMRTSAPAVYAAGDVAEFDGQVPGLWPTAVDQARIAAVNATGGDDRFRAAPAAVILKGVGLDLTVAGRALGSGHAGSAGEDEEVITVSGPTRYAYCRLVVAGGVLVGGLVLDRPADAAALLEAVRGRMPVGHLLTDLRAGNLGVLPHA